LGGGWLRGSFFGHERRRLILVLGGIIRVVFDLKHGGHQMLEIKSHGLVSFEHEGGRNGTKVYAKMQKHTQEK
jgi:hypothetical protein